MSPAAPVGPQYPFKQLLPLSAENHLMKNRDPLPTRVAALLVSLTLGLACSVERDWSVCTKNVPNCHPGYTCDLVNSRCVPIDAGGDAMGVADRSTNVDAVSQGPALVDAAGDMLGLTSVADAGPEVGAPDVPISSSGGAGAGGGGGTTGAALADASAAGGTTAPADASVASGTTGGVVGGGSGTGGMAGSADLAPSPDISSEPDAAPDMSAPVDLGPDLVRDLPYGHEVAPDVGWVGCEIGGNTYDSGAANPANACQLCKPAASSSTWSNVDEGSPCTGGVCSGGICQIACWIGGTLVGAGITNSSNACQLCKPATAASAWSSVGDGTSCGSGPTCSGTTKSYGHWTCQGGSCVQPSPTTCPSTGCDTSTGLCKDACGTGSTAGPVQCGTTCCTTDEFCLSNTNCAPKAGPGWACPNGSAQCTTNYCVDGTCCGSSSCGRGETCGSGTCACAMNAARVCNTCADWDFEWGTTASPWLLDLAPVATNLGLTNGATGVAITSSLYHVGTGSHALIAQLDLDPNALNDTGEVAISLSCATSLAGYRLSVWLYLAGPALSHWNDGLVLDTWNGSTSGELLPLFNGGVPTGQWVQANVTIPAADTTMVNRVGIRLVPSVVWSGQMYIDDVVLMAP